MTGGVNIIDKCNARFQEIFTSFNKSSDGKITVSHFGEFSQDLVNSLTISIENAMYDSGDKKGVVKRMFSVLIEGLQNIRIHGERDEYGTQVSFLVIHQNTDAYKICFGNLVKKEKIKKIEEILSFLNSEDQVVVKQRYMEVLSLGEISSKGGAGLGFITMALKTKQPISYHALPVSDELACLSIELSLPRV
ncbi:hypothetical protein DNU06_05330 [Putridiphycobacter roseus]|uniref:Uncharacterized protein n=1 Tax=Putridiphycobacter roseus TaxID=2219161 RepID=A0A2W1N4N5_9FLAO|nr:SiaB family protein kinase [Putridiphycobacter roseus]PZE18041.1 hypothetical protein DNU06_05330 [Putridiphycobacter roseus]